jgi:O-methyltransferase
MQNSKALDLNLMKKCLTNYLSGETFAPIMKASKFQPLPRRFMINSLVGANALIQFLTRNSIELVRRYPFDPAKRQVGQDFPPSADTMIGLARLENIQHCIEEVLRHNVPGDLIETGVWRGGTLFS